MRRDRRVRRGRVRVASASVRDRWVVAALIGLLALLAAMVIALPAAAQQATSGQAMVLSLDEAIRIARGQNPTYRQAMNTLDLNGPETRNTWLTQLIPSLNLNLFSTTYSGNLSNIGSDDFGNPVRLDNAEFQYFSSSRQNIQLSWSFQGASLFQDLKGQNLNNADRLRGEEIGLWTLESDLRSQYFDALEQAELLRIEQELADDQRINFDITERLFEIADRTQVDLLNAEFQVEQQERSILQQQRQYDQAILTLRTTIGDPDLPPIELQPEEISVFDPSQLDADALVLEALRFNPTMRQQEASVDQNELAVDRARNVWWPNISASFSLGRTNQLSDTEALFDFSPNEPKNSSFGITLSIPYFNSFFQNQFNQTQAEVNLRNSEESLRESRLSTEQSVRSALVTLQNQYDNLVASQRSLDIAERSLEMSREEYRVGAITFEQLQSAVNNVATSRRDILTGQYGFVDAVFQLEQAIGSRIQVPGSANEGGN